MSNYLTLTGRTNSHEKISSATCHSFYRTSLWMGFIYLVDSLYIKQLFSMLIYVDVTTMAILLVGGHDVF
ncbi:hypothetical protein KHA80_15330 [Anaerobacillus sp. HL2]|nr:hypothetical protein KHA80_15330 [Anaerobacillus sp. HL2]